MTEKKILIHGDGANNGTTFTDSFGNVTLTPSYEEGTVVTSTAQYKWGTASIHPTSDAYYLSFSPTDLGFSNKEFNIDFWVWPTTEDTIILGQYDSGGGGDVLKFVNNSVDGTITANLCYGGAYDEFSVTSDSTYPITLSAWNHVRLYMIGNVFTIKVNGHPGTPVTQNVTLNTATVPFTIGHESGFGGYIDEVFIHIADPTFTYPNYATAAVPTGPYDSNNYGDLGADFPQFGAGLEEIAVDLGAAFPQFEAGLEEIAINLGASFPVFSGAFSGSWGLLADMGADFPVFSATLITGAGMGASFPLFSSGLTGHISGVSGIGATFPVFKAGLTGKASIACDVGADFPIFNSSFSGISIDSLDIGAEFPIFSVSFTSNHSNGDIGASFPVFLSWFTSYADVFGTTVLSYDRDNVR